MKDNKELVTEVTENVEGQTTEENVGVETVEQSETVEMPKTYTEDELNARVDELLAKKIARKEARIRKEYDKKYGRLENVLKAGTGEQDVDKLADTFANFYTDAFKKKGMTFKVDSEPTYNENDMKVLANAEAQTIIEYGYDDVVEEVDRLAEIGVENMTPRERLVFTQLAEYRKAEEDKKDLAKIGVNEAALQDKDFIEFANNLNPNMSIKDKYTMYTKYRPKPEVETMGSMKNSTNGDTGVKDFYTRDEALKFTKKDFDKNPALYKAVEQSMLKW